MTHPLVRNPVLRLSLGYWWAVLLVALLVTLPWTVPHGFMGALTALALLLGLATGVVGKAILPDARRERQEAAARHERGERCLCPHCLQFGKVRFGCPQCGHEVAGFLIRTAGRYVDSCEKCVTVLPLNSDPATLPEQCSVCSHIGGAGGLHGRRVRVFGVLSESDFQGLSWELGRQAEIVAGIRFTRRDDGDTATYVLNLADLSARRDLLPATHAARSVEEIWIRQCDPLALVEALDQFAARACLDAAALRRIRLSTAASLDPAAERALAARLGPRRNDTPPQIVLAGPAPQAGA